MIDVKKKSSLCWISLKHAFSSSFNSNVGRITVQKQDTWNVSLLSTSCWGLGASPFVGVYRALKGCLCMSTIISQTVYDKWQRWVTLFLTLPFVDHTCYGKGTWERQNGRKKLLFLGGCGKSVMFQDCVFPYNKSFLERSQKEVLGLTTA